MCLRNLKLDGPDSCGLKGPGSPEQKEIEFVPNGWTSLSAETTNQCLSNSAPAFPVAEGHPAVDTFVAASLSNVH